MSSTIFFCAGKQYQSLITGSGLTPLACYINPGSVLCCCFCFVFEHFSGLTGKMNREQYQQETVVLAKKCIPGEIDCNAESVYAIITYCFTAANRIFSPDKQHCVKVKLLSYDELL